MGHVTNDVRVLEPREHFCLAFEALGSDTTASEQHLHRNRSSGRTIVCLIHDTDATRAHSSQQLEAIVENLLREHVGRYHVDRMS
jgi:hypothetical protein